MPDETFDPLSLDNQLCFPLYVASRRLIQRYQPLLEPLSLTYPQYVAMMALWEHDGITITELSRRIRLDSATLTPLLRRLEDRGYILRTRSTDDERSIIVTLSDAGINLRERALSVPARIGACIDMEPADAIELKRLLEQLIGTLDQSLRHPGSDGDHRHE